MGSKALRWRSWEAFGTGAWSGEMARGLGTGVDCYTWWSREAKRAGMIRKVDADDNATGPHQVPLTRWIVDLKRTRPDSQTQTKDLVEKLKRQHGANA